VETTHNIPWLGLDDPIAALTHLFAAVAAIFVIAPLWRRSTGKPWRRMSVLVFGVSTFVLFTASGSYHAASGPLKASLRRLDHASIYVLIAGTFTPVVAHLTSGWVRSRVLTWIWGFAAAGVVSKLLFFGALPDWVDTLLYLAMGWLGVIPAIPIARARRYGVLGWMGLGAVLYTVGALAELFRWPVIVPRVFGYHEIFHLAVMGGSAAFLSLILRHIVPREREGRRVVRLETAPE